MVYSSVSKSMRMVGGLSGIVVVLIVIAIGVFVYTYWSKRTPNLGVGVNGWKNCGDWGVCLYKNLPDNSFCRCNSECNSGCCVGDQHDGVIESGYCENQQK